MDRRLARIAALVTFLAVLLCWAAEAPAGGGPQNVLVVANRDSERSVAIAEHYLARRRIPRTNLLLVSCSGERSVDFRLFRDQVADPVRRALHTSELHGRIDYIVLTDGVPIRAQLPGGHVSTCALLQVLDTPAFGRPQTPLPVLENPYRNAGLAFSHAAAFEGQHLYLVTFLIGYTEEDAKRLVDLSVASDGKPQKGDFIFQDAQGNAAGRNPGYDDAIRRLVESGFKAEHKPAGAEEVKQRAGIMGYMSGGAYSQLKRENTKTLGFHPGAIADMLESFGAVPENFDPSKQSQFPVTWLIEAGVTGVHGAVAEPYAHTFPDVRLFQRYAEGCNLAEAFYQSLPFLYWMNMVIGDPLAAPYAVRPEIRIEAEGAAPFAGTVSLKIEAKTPGPDPVARILVYFEGREIAAVEGASASVAWDTLKFRNGKGTLLAAAVLSGPSAVQGHAFLEAAVKNADLAVIRSLPAAGDPDAPREGPVQVEFNKELSPACAGASDLALLDEKGGRVPGRWIVEEDRHLLSFLLESPLAPGSKYEIRVPAGVTCAEGKALKGAPAAFGFVTTAAGLSLDAPKKATAGQEFEVEAKALGANGEVWPGFRGELRISCDDALSELPEPRRLGEADQGRGRFKAVLRTAGERILRIVDEAGGVEGEARVLVEPGPFAAVEIDLPREAAFGQETEASLSARDAFGNVAASYEGEVRLEAPTNANADFPASVTFAADDRGVKNIRGVRFGVRGMTGLVALAPDGRKLGQGATQVVDSAIRSWLRLGPFPAPAGKPAEAKPPIDPSASRPSPGRIEAGSVWEPSPAGSGVVSVSAPQGQLALFHAWVKCSGPGDGLRIGSSDLVAVWVNGKKAYECAKARAFKADEDTPPNVPLQAGWNRLLVLAARSQGGAPQFSVKVADASGKNPDGFRVALADPEGIGRLDVSGLVLAGGKGLAGVSVQLAGGAKALKATTDALGRFAFQGVEKGELVLKPSKEGLEFEPPERKIRVEDENRYGLVFAVADRASPRVTLLAVPDRNKAAGVVEVEFGATDNLGVAEVRFLLDGKPFGDPVRADKGKTPVDFRGVAPGTHTLGAVARDGAGNDSEPLSIKIWVVKDTAKPEIALVKPKTAQLPKGKLDLEAKVTDNIAVVSVKFLFDSREAAATRKDGTWTASMDLSKEKPGPHELTVIAEDSSGNRTEKKFKVTVKDK